jgi:hypothetical protein
MTLFRLDAEHDDEAAGSFARFYRTEVEADQQAQWLADFGWSVDWYPTEVPERLTKRLCAGVWPNAHDARLFELAASAREQAAEDLQMILKRKERNRAQ